ncbi:hypothetical protein USDA257_c54710 [Sinorhizobium fredii USDA 257]|uniref:Uncharacterized protein n=1 Tax=Sinorhizobium fredii (strain USDA 257) TaxID=1185652 RepID=I3XDN0_SINF2|nr:hypothetical protein USDA257_c54710 [Sinorhizobium fredii USDA 257]
MPWQCRIDAGDYAERHALISDLIKIRSVLTLEAFIRLASLTTDVLAAA